MISKQIHISLYVNNIEKSLKFYRNLLGFKVIVQIEKSEGLKDIHGKLLGVGDKVIIMDGIELIQKNENSIEIYKKENQKLNHIGIVVENIEKAITNVESKGIEPTIPLTNIEWKDWGYAIKTYFFKDPDNNDIEFIEWSNSNS